MKKYLLILVPAAIVAAWWFYHQWQHWLAYATGSYNTQGVAHNYNFFSGAGSDIGEYVIVTSVVGSALLVWRTHTCQGAWWCWRHPSHGLDGTPYKLCTKHHPADVPTVKEAISQATNGGRVL